MTRARVGAADSVLETLLYEIRRLPGCERTKAAVLRLLASHAGARIYVARSRTLHLEQQCEARRLLDVGLARGEAARRLSRKYGFSESTAYRRLSIALRAPR